MTQEEKLLLTKDLCARLPYGVKCYVPVENCTMELTGKRLNYFCFHKDVWGIDYSREFEVVLDPLNDAHNGYIIKPYLRPMSSMTEEERKEYKHLVAFSGSPDGAANFIDWLNKNMFDYRGLIPMNLALEASKGIYTKKRINMDYKQKYEEALERAKRYQGMVVLPAESMIETIFPELAESQDEKIRGDIISLVNEFWERIGSINPEYSSRSRMIDWLEKQKSEVINVKALLTADRLAAAEMTGRLKERKDIVENPQKYGLEKQGEKEFEWSKEDDNHLHSIYHYLRILKDESDNDSIKKNIEEHINWLSKLYQIFLAPYFQ